MLGADESAAKPEGEPATAPEAEPVEEVREPAPLLELRDGLPTITETEASLGDVVTRFAAGTGPVAIDAERASGYRYSARAYLVQLRRQGSGTALVDPIAFDGLDELDEALQGVEWILHAATQDLPCLAEVGLRPSTLFDTELAGRLLGYPRVGLATLVELVVGRSLRKEHSAVDWSTRPLPEPWLEYAALDVEALVELRETLGRELDEAGKASWAQQEFAHLVDAPMPSPRREPWRRTSGTHRTRDRRVLAAVRELWETRDDIAARRDVAPGRVLPDSAIVEAALAMPRDRATLLAVRGFRGRGAERYAREWADAVARARSMPEEDLPPVSMPHDGPPPPRAWADRDPVAAARLTHARNGLKKLAEELVVPVENLLTPDYVRRLMWQPPDADAAPGEATGAGDLTQAVSQRLRDLGARPWQVDLTTGVLAAAIESAAG